QGSIFSAIGAAINSVISAIASVIMAIVGGIVTVCPFSHTHTPFTLAQPSHAFHR
ncbi:hypothetical protein BOTBODRAFT_38008, partial [Botryobasidium botryosum FD-172 SS1]